jgi:hypothetical protein
MNREEANAEVRKIQRICRGLPLLTEEKRVELHTAWHAAHANLDIAAATDVVRRAEEAINKPYRPDFVHEDWQTLSARASDAIFAHSMDCGVDFNDIIVAGPYDGQHHDYKCPKCGQTGTYRAPYFELQEA